MTRLAERQREFMAMLEAPAPPADPRLAVYHAAVRANRHDALASVFPVTRRLVGEAFFAAAVEAYAASHPSRSGDLAQLGDRFAAFLSAYAPAGSLDYLPDVARLEWALHESSRAADAPAADFGALREVAPDRIGAVRLRLHPAVRLVASPHPVLAIWEANQAARDGTPELTEEPDRLLVMRIAHEPVVRRVPRGEFEALLAMQRGASLAAVCAALGDDADGLDEWLARHARSGVICGFELAA